jgi:hypothetical protein
VVCRLQRAFQESLPTVNGSLSHRTSSDDLWVFGQPGPVGSVVPIRFRLSECASGLFIGFLVW